MTKPATASADGLLRPEQLFVTAAVGRQDAAHTFSPLGRTMWVPLLEVVGRGHTRPKDPAKLLGTVPPAVAVMITELEQRGARRQTGQKRFSTFSAAELEVFTRLRHNLLDA